MTGEIEMINHYNSIISANKELEEALYNACDFSFTDMYIMNDGEDLLEFGKSDYEVKVFGNDARGGAYVLLNDMYVGYMSSEGECGIIAKNIKDFFNIICICKMLYDYFHFCILDSADEFVDMVKTQNENVEDEYKELLNQFIQDNDMETDLKKIYSMLVSAVIIEPEFVIEPTVPEYGYSDSLFGFMNDTYLQELRKKH